MRGTGAAAVTVAGAITTAVVGVSADIVVDAVVVVVVGTGAGVGREVAGARGGT